MAGFAGCGTAAMRAPTDFDPGQVEFETDGRDGEASEGEDAAFTLGPYQVGDVRRNLSLKKSGFDGVDGFVPAKKRGYRFAVTGGGEKELTGECSEAALQTTEELDGSLSVTEDDASLACICAAAGIPVTRLFVEDIAGQYAGPFSVGGVGARVVASYELENGDRLVGRPAGFRVEDEKGTVAAAGILPGDVSVWVREGLVEPERSQLVCGLVGLMLWVPRAWPEPKEDEDDSGDE